MNVKINDQYVGYYIHAKKENKEFKGYVLDEVMDDLTVLVTDTLKGLPNPIEYVKTKHIAAFNDIPLPINEYKDKTKSYKNFMIGFLASLGVIGLGLQMYLLSTLYLMISIYLYADKNRCDKCGK